MAHYDAEGNVTDSKIKLFRCTMAICEPCIDGKGRECHTAGCALWLHRVDLPMCRALMDRCDLICEVDNA